MDKQVAILLADGFEEGEAIIILDIFRRLQINIEALSIGNQLELTSYHNVKMQADALLKDRAATLYDAIIMPGGPQGARNLGNSEEVVEFVKKHLAADKYVCPFCSAGAHVMAKNNLLGSKKYTTSGKNYELYNDGNYVDQNIVIEGKLITGKGLGVVFEYAFTLAALFAPIDKVKWEADHIYFYHWQP
ncbi:MAG: DJ-1/PfpI family protein [Spirochaetaceae bacterium]|nr:DJ-1/PfpI family protein [Spirochaetaceae bacterium]